MNSNPKIPNIPDPYKEASGPNNPSNPIKKRGRKPGQKNKVFGVKLKDLCAAFNPEFIVPVSKSLALTLKMSNASIQIVEMDEEKVTSKPIEKINIQIEE
jgi:hypothetical protein